ncbi:MAG: hypothetical protein ACYTHK_02160 [Planctomycetota bacterium]|jgi:hypothetical protein
MATLDWTGLERTVDEVRVSQPGPDEGCRTFRLRRNAAGLRRGDLLFVIPGARPEGGEFVIDPHFRLGRHGGGPVWGVVVGMVRTPLSGRRQR